MASLGVRHAGTPGPTGVKGAGGSGGHGRAAKRGAWPGCRWAVAGPGRASRRRATQQQSQRPQRCGGCRRDRRAWLRCPWAVAGPGRASRRRAERSSRRGRLAGGPPPTGTSSSPAPSGPGGTRIRRQLSEAADQPTLHVAPSRPSATVTPATARRSRSSSARAQSLAARAAARSSRTA